MLTAVAGGQFFLYVRGQDKRQATKFVTVAVIVTQNKTWKKADECRGTKLKDGEKVSYQGKHIYEQCGQPRVETRCVFLLTARWYGKLPSVSGLACVFA
jgi:hypothetical protein